MASNVLRGDLPIVHADSLPPGGLALLDVRSRAEHEAASIPGSTTIPLDELRGRLGEIPADRPLVVYSQSGRRSYLAVRVLRQMGFKAWSLSGGFLTYRLFHSAAPAGR
jgi:rhodanese-related sulfurtransferase